jgi:hypothetical protein
MRQTLLNGRLLRIRTTLGIFAPTPTDYRQGAPGHVQVRIRVKAQALMHRQRLVQ